MKEPLGILTHIPFFGVKRDEVASKSEMLQTFEGKKSLILKTITDVERSVFSRRVDVRKNEERLHLVRRDRDEIAPTRDEVLGRYREADSDLTTLLKKIEGVKLKRLDLKRRMETALLKKGEQALRSSVLTDEAIQEADCKNLRNRLGELTGSHGASKALLAGLERDHASLSNIRGELSLGQETTDLAIGELLEKKGRLAHERRERESTLKLLEEVRDELSREKTRRDELASLDSSLELHDSTNRERVEELKSRQEKLADELAHLEREERSLKEENVEVLKRSEQVKSLNDSLEIAASQMEESSVSLKGLEKRLETVGGEEGEVEGKLLAMGDETKTYEAKRVEIEERARPLIETLNGLSEKEARVHEEKESLNDKTGERESIKEEIRTKELEIHYYKEALEEILSNV